MKISLLVSRLHFLGAKSEYLLQSSAFWLNYTLFRLYNVYEDNYDIERGCKFGMHVGIK